MLFLMLILGNTGTVQEAKDREIAAGVGPYFQFLFWIFGISIQ